MIRTHIENFAHVQNEWSLSEYWICNSNLLFYIERILKCWFSLIWYLLSGIYLLKSNYRSTKTRCEIYSKLIIKTPVRPGVVLLSLSLTLNIFHTLCVSVVNFEHVITGWIYLFQQFDTSFSGFVTRPQIALAYCSKQKMFIWFA